MKDTRLIFGGTIAIILLGLYAYSLTEAIRLALADNPGTLKPGFATTLSTVGGLVSALVIAELAIVRPGEAPVVRTLTPADPNAPPPSDAAKRNVAIISTLYVLVWLVLGLAAFIVGAMLHAGKVQPLTDFGQAWLGLCVAAGYSYFGIRPA
jgi:hypothetical protein